MRGSVFSKFILDIFIWQKLLYRSDATWMQEFLERQGLEALFESLQRLSQKTTTLQGAVILINCVECLRAVMNCPTGLNHIVEHHQYTRRILEGQCGQVFCKFRELYLFLVPQIRPTRKVL